MPTLWVDPGFGAAGDMLLGALCGLGVDVDSLRAQLASLGVDGWTLTVGTVERCGLVATRAEVDAAVVEHHRHWRDIDALLAGAALPTRAVARARAAFRRLAEVEAAQHGIAVDAVHFHEVGAVDSIVDTVGVCLALEALGVDRVVVGPVGIGHGVVRTAHGVLPVPAPATAALLVGAPVRPVDAPFETVTPTAAALLVTLADHFGPVPAGTLRAVARGAGGRDPATHPNVVSVVLVEETAAAATSLLPDVVDAVVLATNLDDVTPEVLGHTVERLLALGADDAWIIPMLMKKGRPAHELRVLAAPGRVGVLIDAIARETGTLGVRATAVRKHMAARTTTTVEVRGHPVRMKVGPAGAKPEHDDLAAVAAATGEPLRRLADEARRSFADRVV
jgi:uncharacterized protein (TIGR00299 family) protein